MICVLYYITGFLLFTVLQSLFINGVFECFKGGKLVDGINKKISYQGMVFYMMAPKFFERHRYKNWIKPFWGCVSCMASFWGAATFWPLVIHLFSFHWIEVYIFFMDVFILVYLNRYFYNKL